MGRWKAGTMKGEQGAQGERGQIGGAHPYGYSDGEGGDTGWRRDWQNMYGMTACAATIGNKGTDR